MALSPDGRTLYAALADMNAVGVVNLASGKITGYIPTGWYPTAVVAAPYRRLLVTDAKGTQTQYPNPAYKQYDFGNNAGYDPNVGFDPNVNAPKGNPYDLNLIEGTAQLLSLPTATQQVQDTQLVLANSRLSSIGANPLPPQALAGIKHVIYIIKENRTYDQVLGDLPQGNGDPSLALFGQSVTPNLHALASGSCCWTTSTTAPRRPATAGRGLRRASRRNTSSRTCPTTTATGAATTTSRGPTTTTTSAASRRRTCSRNPLVAGYSPFARRAARPSPT